MAYKILNGIRIIDLTMVYAGPVATKIMAELGAEVIKIESSQRSDVFTRANVYPENKPDGEHWNRGSFFHSLNAGKRAISLNLGTDKGRGIFRQLVKISDVVIENFSPRVMQNWGLDYEELKIINPRIVMVSISGLGNTGPLKNYSMYVPGMEGMSGLTYVTGYPDQPPLLSGNAYGDWVTGTNAAMALITALYHQKATGQGQYVDISGREATICHIGDVVMDYTLNKHDRTRTGNMHPQFAPHGCYRCKGEDEWVAIGVENAEQWNRFKKTVGNPDLQNMKYSSTRARRENQTELDRLIEEWTIQKDKFEIMQILQKARVPAGALLNMKEINLNPQLKNRGFFKLIDHGKTIGQRPIPRQLPAKFRGLKEFPLKRAPYFNEDTEYILGSLLKLSGEDIQLLEKDNIIGSLPTFPSGRPTRVDLIEKQQAGCVDPEYLPHLQKHFGVEIGQSVEK
jgi:crotonobetainyl-CoA:carnitine CoA-transferase CaiB-like acyl-CoA transferase